MCREASARSSRPLRHWPLHDSKQISNLAHLFLLCTASFLSTIVYEIEVFMYRMYNIHTLIYIYVYSITMIYHLCIEIDLLFYSNNLVTRFFFSPTTHSDRRVTCKTV